MDGRAHIVPPEFRDDRERYVDLLIDDLIPAVGRERLAVCCDVFVETGAFTVDDTQYLLTFVIMVAVALVISNLVERIRAQAREQAALSVAAESERIRSRPPEDSREETSVESNASANRS